MDSIDQIYCEETTLDDGLLICFFFKHFFFLFSKFFLSLLFSLHRWDRMCMMRLFFFLSFILDSEDPVEGSIGAGTSHFIGGLVLKGQLPPQKAKTAVLCLTVFICVLHF